jgi:hypothetical protein
MSQKAGTDAESYFFQFVFPFRASLWQWMNFKSTGQGRHNKKSKTASQKPADVVAIAKLF